MEKNLGGGAVFKCGQAALPPPAAQLAQLPRVGRDTGMDLLGHLLNSPPFCTP